MLQICTHPKNSKPTFDSQVWGNLCVEEKGGSMGSFAASFRAVKVVKDFRAAAPSSACAAAIEGAAAAVTALPFARSTQKEPRGWPDFLCQSPSMNKKDVPKRPFFLQLPFLLLLLLFFFAFQNFNNGNAYSIVWGCYQGRTFLGETNLPLNCHPFFVRRLCLLLCSLLHLRCQQTPCKKYRCGASFATIHCVSRTSKKVPKRYRISNFHMRSW